MVEHQADQADQERPGRRAGRFTRTSGGGGKLGGFGGERAGAEQERVDAGTLFASPQTPFYVLACDAMRAQANAPPLTRHHHSVRT